MFLSALVDYTPISEMLTFNSTVRRIEVNLDIVDDDLMEGDENIVLSLSSTDMAVQLNPKYAAITITDRKQYISLVCIKLTHTHTHTHTHTILNNPKGWVVHPVCQIIERWEA